MFRLDTCPGCRKYAPLREDTGLCASCAKKAQQQAKAAREAAREAGKRPPPAASVPVPPPAARPRPSEPPTPPRSAAWDSEPLLGPAWNAAMAFREASSTARHQVLAAVRQAAAGPEPGAVLGRLLHHLQSRPDPVKAACAAALEAALSYLPQGSERLVDFTQALVAYADFSATLQAGLPEVTLRPGAAGEVAAEWLLFEAWEVARELEEVDAGPVRQILAYLRGLLARPGRAGAWEERRWKIALLVPLAAASAARGVKTARSARPARLRLLELARWGAERAIAEPDALERVVLPAIEAVVAYHGLVRELERPGPRGAPAGPPQEPPDYLANGYFDASGGPQVRLFESDALAWAGQMASDQVSTGQIRRFFHEIRRLEGLARSRPWAEVRAQLWGLAPLAADAVARGLKEGRNFRALGLLVERNVDRLRQLPEEEQRHAFLEGLVPHFEAVLAHFNARGLGAAPDPEPLPADATRARDESARRRAAALREGGISPTLLRRVYGHVRGLERCAAAARPAEVARVVALTEDALRRSAGTAAAKTELRRLVRAAQQAEGDAFTTGYLPHFESVVAWFVGLPALGEG